MRSAATGGNSLGTLPASARGRGVGVLIPYAPYIRTRFTVGCTTSSGCIARPCDIVTACDVAGAVTDLIRHHMVGGEGVFLCVVGAMSCGFIGFRVG